MPRLRAARVLLPLLSRMAFAASLSLNSWICLSKDRDRGPGPEQGGDQDGEQHLAPGVQRPHGDPPAAGHDLGAGVHIVEAFLVGVHDLCGFAEERDFLDHLVAGIAVLAHHKPTRKSMAQAIPSEVRDACCFDGWPEPMLVPAHRLSMNINKDSPLTAGSQEKTRKCFESFIT